MKKHFKQNLTGLIFLVVGFISFPNIIAVAQCPTTNALTIPSNFLGGTFNGDGNFNAIVIGNYNTGDGGTDGRLAVGGNFTLNSVLTGYSIGSISLPTKDNFIVNGTLTNSTGGQIHVKGNAIYRALGASSPLPVHESGEGGNTQATGVIDFVALKQHFIDMGNGYEALTPAITASVSAGVVTLTGNNTIINYVFNVDLGGDAISEIKFVNIPAGSGILINILDSYVEFSPNPITPVDMVTTYREKTLFNFPNASNILLSSFKIQGSLLAPVSDLTVLQGQINGAAVIGGNIIQATGFNFNTSCLSYPLPVKLLSFTAKKEGNTTGLKWETSSEINAEKFVVERSVSTKSWNVLGEVAAKGESATTLSYHFTDAKPLSGSNLYRLKMVDRDGTTAFSRIISVNSENTTNVKAFPNPVVEKLSFDPADASRISDLQIFDQIGKPVSFSLNSEKKIDVKHWPQGLYTIKLTTKDGVVTSQKILKN